LAFLQAEDGIRDFHVTGVQTCALPIYRRNRIIVEYCALPLTVRNRAVDRVAKVDEESLVRFMRHIAANPDSNRLRGNTRVEKQKIGRASCRERGQSSGARVPRTVAHHV